MFGNYNKKFDSKMRVIIPAKLREKLGNPFYVTRGPDNVIEVRSQTLFVAFQEKLLANNMLNQNARNFVRLLLGSTYELSYDEQGRAIFPKQLLESAHITTEITFVGVGNRIELWNPKAYQKFLDTNGEKTSLEKLAQKLLKEGVNF